MRMGLTSEGSSEILHLEDGCDPSPWVPPLKQDRFYTSDVCIPSFLPSFINQYWASIVCPAPHWLMSWGCVPSVQGGEEGWKEEKALGRSWGCGPIWTHQHECVWINSKSWEWTSWEQRRLEGKQQKVIGSGHHRGVIGGVRGEPGEGREPQWVLLQETRQELRQQVGHLTNGPKGLLDQATLRYQGPWWNCGKVPNWHGLRRRKDLLKRKHGLEGGKAVQQARRVRAGSLFKMGEAEHAVIRST